MTTPEGCPHCGLLYPLPEYCGALTAEEREKCNLGYLQDLRKRRRLLLEELADLPAEVRSSTPDPDVGTRPDPFAARPSAPDPDVETRPARPDPFAARPSAPDPDFPKPKKWSKRGDARATRGLQVEGLAWLSFSSGASIREIREWGAFIFTNHGAGGLWKSLGKLKPLVYAKIGELMGDVEAYLLKR